MIGGGAPPVKPKDIQNMLNPLQESMNCPKEEVKADTPVKATPAEAPKEEFKADAPVEEVKAEDPKVEAKPEVKADAPVDAAAKPESVALR